jgi:group I intron endonuclease
MNIVNGELLLDSGVYKIKNLINNKCYIGSTKMTFLKRFYHHQSSLRNGTHKNIHLQNSFNKYKEENFEFEIIEVCEKENCFNREQVYLDNTENIYNINKNATGIDNSQRDIIEKRRQTLLRRYKNGELDHVKEMSRNRIPWNKGMKMENTDYLKVPKKNKGNRDLFNANLDVKMKIIDVYSLDGIFIISGNTRTLYKESLKENNVFIKYMILKNKIGRNGYSPYILKKSTITKAVKHNIPYKGLMFKNKTSPFIEQSIN